MTQLEPVNVLRKLPLTVDDFLLLDESGAFDGYGKTELIDGEIFYMNAQHSRHGRMKMLVANTLNAIFSENDMSLEALVEVTMRCDPGVAPIPDVMVTSYTGDSFVPANTVRLIVEISDTTQKSDLGKKSALYANAGIAEYWVFDISGGTLHQMWVPQDGQYSHNRQVSAGEMITAKTIDGLTIRLPA